MDEKDVAEMVWGLARAITTKADLRDHISALEGIWEICEAVAQGRYLEDCQRCNWGQHRCEHECTANLQHCDGFDERDPHAAVADWFDDLTSFRDEVRAWMVAPLPLTRDLRALVWGPDGLFGGATLVGYTQDEDGMRRPVSEEGVRVAWATRDADEDRAKESMALRVDQYDLNRQRIKQICAQQGDLQEIASLIQEGMPPTRRQPISPSSYQLASTQHGASSHPGRVPPKNHVAHVIHLPRFVALAARVQSARA